MEGGRTKRRVFFLKKTQRDNKNLKKKKRIFFISIEEKGQL